VKLGIALLAVELVAWGLAWLAAGEIFWLGGFWRGLQSVAWYCGLVLAMVYLKLDVWVALIPLLAADYAIHRGVEWYGKRHAAAV
jgi:hypothetical protein